MNKKKILNYTTQISAEKTLGEIQRLLAQAKAQAVLTEYDTEGVLTAISFRIGTQAGLMSFRLPGNVEKIHKAITRDNRIARRLQTREQASRVAWRILKDWLEAQLALIEAEMVDVVQVFLPYAQDSKTGVTVYESLMNSRFKGLALPSGSEGG